MSETWELFVDTGGTFTDALARTPSGELLRTKVLSSGALRGRIEGKEGPRVYRVRHGWQAEVDVLKGGRFRVLPGGTSSIAVARFEPASHLLELDQEPETEIADGASFEVSPGEEAPVLAARMLTGTAAGEALPPLAMRLGTTLATNALLTRSGAPTVLFVTRGFADLLEIGTQQRPDLFALEIRKPAPIHRAVLEVDERLAADGSELRPLETSKLAEPAAALLRDGIRSAAVALLHADRNPEHEQRLGEFLEKLGFEHVSCSSDLARSIRILPRAVTAVVNACLEPEVAGYLRGIRRHLSGGNLLTMTSAGGLVNATTARPKDLLLSGPAGGVVGAARAGEAVGCPRVISFDMGGTSTDVARFDGDFDYLFEHTVGDAHLFAPALAIETVAAGGGSICRHDHTGLSVGPESSGADPGPACYGAGGPLSLTDVNLLLGRLDPERFWIPVDAQAAQSRLDEILASFDANETPTAEDVLAGFLEIADERMADAIRRISIRRGYDPAEYALVAFGGAGGQHACAVADRLGVDRVIVPTDAGLLSALGMAGAVVERFAERQLLAPLIAAAELVPDLIEELEREARAALAGEGVASDQIGVRRRIAEMRFVGQESTLQVEVEQNGSLADAFAERYLAVYGHQPAERPVELVSLRVVASSEPRALTAEAAATAATSMPDTRRAWFDGGWQEVPVHDRAALPPGRKITGPALVLEHHSATVVAPGWRLTVANNLTLDLLRTDADRSTTAQRVRPEAVQLELFTHRFEAIAREMGEALGRTAVSTNVKERQDFSCALLDAAGQLVVNAPHIPVHLGSMGLCVRSVAEAMQLKPGDMVLTNHPAFGGSHLPDLTVIAPIFGKSGAKLGYAAARAHHAEIGGSRPGSMPASARTLAEEGVVIPPTLLLEGGVGRWDDIERILGGGRWPSRAIPDNLTDLRAAAAACHQGVKAVTELAEEHGEAMVRYYMTALEDRAEARMRQALAELQDGTYEAEERLDDGTPLRAAIVITGDRASIDFTGSGSTHEGNLNATPAIVRSVVIYVLRLLVQEDLPLNEGLMRPVDLLLPEGILNPIFPDDPTQAPAIVGGNVETSQRLVDTLMRALKLGAASQGTMNNLIFGNRSFSYYETVCGGCGAGPGFAGAHAVHSHMTNTRITDPEILEHRCPVRVERFAIRRGSGGAGRFAGGDGVVREIRFLEPVELSLLCQRRREGPFGMAGGEPGAPGRQWLKRADGTTEELSSSYSGDVAAGDAIVLETPGGGGYGTPDESEKAT